jgi:hypothetical protein
VPTPPSWSSDLPRIRLAFQGRCQVRCSPPPLKAASERHRSGVGLQALAVRALARDGGAVLHNSVSNSSPISRPIAANSAPSARPMRADNPSVTPAPIVIHIHMALNDLIGVTSRRLNVEMSDTRVLSELQPVARRQASERDRRPAASPEYRGDNVTRTWVPSAQRPVWFPRRPGSIIRGGVYAFCGADALT